LRAGQLVVIEVDLLNWKADVLEGVSNACTLAFQDSSIYEYEIAINFTLRARNQGMIGESVMQVALLCKLDFVIISILIVLGHEDLLHQLLQIVLPTSN